MAEQNYVVETTLRPVPPDTYKEKGRAEMEYTQEQMTQGKLTQLLVTENHRNYWMVYAVEDAQELLEILNGFKRLKFTPFLK